MENLYLQGDLFEGFISSQTETAQIKKFRKMSTRGLWNLNLDVNGTFKYDRMYEIPVLKPYNGKIPSNLVAYSAISKCPNNVCPHFYMNDTSVPLLFNNIEYYTEKLRRFDCVISTDYSMFCGAPIAVNLHSLFLNRSIAAYWQEHGLNVIPSFNGGDAKSFEYCLVGLPKNSVLATGNVGVLHSPVTTRLWKYMVEKAINELEPTALIIYGTKIEFEHPKDLQIYWHDDFIHRKLRNISSKHKQKS